MVSFLGQKDIRWCLVFKGCHCYTFTHILKATSVEIFFFSFWLVKSRKELKRAIIMNDLPYAFWWWCHCQSPSYFVPNCLFPILLQRFTDSHKLPHWKNSNRPENSLPLLTGPLRLGFSVLESVFPFLDQMWSIFFMTLASLHLLFQVQHLAHTHKDWWKFALLWQWWSSNLYAAHSTIYWKIGTDFSLSQ